MIHIKNKNIIWLLTKKLSNLNTSIIILLIIATTSILGTIIEQDQSLSYYQINYPINDNALININWKFIISFGLNHVYATWWFLSLLILFFYSLITCTFSRQLPGLRNARNWKFIQQVNKNKYSHIVKLNNSHGLSKIIYCLSLKNYYVFNKKQNVYGYKGLIGRIAPIFVHISIILTLTGSIIGLFNGFMAQQMIPNGEIFHIQNIIKSGFSSYLPNNITGKINNFTIEYNSDNSIKQFYSDISLLNNKGKSIERKMIYVNSPLKFHGLTFYQTDWQINGLRIEINNNKIIQAKLEKSQIGNTKIWLYKLPINTNDYISFIITGLQNKILLYNSSGKLLNTIKINETIQIKHENITIKEIMISTGLQIKTDPGILFVYIGFLVLMISIGTSYLSYSQIWAYNCNNTLIVTGNTNRAKLSFEEDLIYINKQYRTYT